MKATITSTALLGHKATFSANQEPELVKHGLKLAFLVCVTSIKFRYLTYYFSEKYKIPAANIYNVDETSISTAHKIGRILGPKGEKQVGAATSWEGGKNLTVLCSVVASENYISRVLIDPT